MWGAPRIHGELLKLGIQVSESVVSKYMVRHPKPPSQSWKTFLANHEAEILAIDREKDVANCGVTEYAFDPAEPPGARMKLQLYNFVAPLREAGAPVTTAPDANVAPR